MTYCTLENLTDRYGLDMLVALTDRADVPTDLVDTDVIDRVLADTDALIDSHLIGRYTLPMASTPPLLADLAQAIAIYKLHASTISDKLKADYLDATKRLGQLSNGTIRLDVAGVEPSGSDSNTIETNNPERPFTNETMKAWI